MSKIIPPTKTPEQWFRIGVACAIWQCESDQKNSSVHYFDAYKNAGGANLHTLWPFAKGEGQRAYNQGWDMMNRLTKQLRIP